MLAAKFELAPPTTYQMAPTFELAFPTTTFGIITTHQVARPDGLDESGARGAPRQRRHEQHAVAGLVVG